MVIVKRKVTKPYVYTDSGILVVRTPASCVTWNSTFRKFLVTDYLKKGSVIPLEVFDKLKEKYSKNNTFVIEKTNISIDIDATAIKAGDRNSKMSIDGFKVINNESGFYIIPDHDNPAMRSLMVYSFLAEKIISGVPYFPVYEIGK